MDPLQAHCYGGPLHGQIHTSTNDRLSKWLVMMYRDIDFYLYELKYELIAGKYYFVTDTEQAGWYAEDQNRRHGEKDTW